jgi:primosomal protein N' (replication factor Y) (superfamily II helicase)
VSRFVQIAVPVPLHRIFSYRLADGQVVQPGVRVEIPFGPRKLVGMVLSEATDEPVGDVPVKKLKSVLHVLDETPVLPPDVLSLSRWLADYYHAPPGEAFLRPLPPKLGGGRGKSLKEHRFKSEEVVHFVRSAESSERVGPKMDAALTWLSESKEATMSDVRDATRTGRDAVLRLAKKGFVRIEKRRVHRDPFRHLHVERDTAPALTDEQSVALETMGQTLGTYVGHLLVGVTGSGKTEVYLGLITQVLERQEGALVLVPEIALTPQLVSRFRARLGDSIAIQHSGLDADARHEQWLRIASGELRVVIGARSALFAPIERLGLIVVDEEHENTYKQDVSPRYHARDMALVRGHAAGCPVVLGTATPSVESWANAQRGKLQVSRLRERVKQRPMPGVEIVDLRETAVVEGSRLLSAPLVDAIAETLERKEQVILFLNRRGYAPFISCQACGEVLRCESCSVSYTWHQGRGRMVCHYCDRVEPPPKRCPSCFSEDLKEVGAGTEAIEDQLSGVFKTATIKRMDRDTTRGQALNKLLDAFRGGQIDVLIGTQMVAKGHDFPNVTLVGVLLAEQGLGIPDFRATERTFQLITQIAGRAGRAGKPGRVLVQTSMPEHYALGFAQKHDSEGFLVEEIARREERNFPPFSHLVLFRIDGPKEGQAFEVASKVAEWAKDSCQRIASATSSLTVVGPAPAPIERIRERHRFQVLLTATRRSEGQQVVRNLFVVLDAEKLPAHVQVSVDVDPLNFL